MSLVVALAALLAGAEPQTFALVIGNNSGGESLPDLAYADDDALRMAALLEEAGAEVELLTRIDTDTARRDGPRPAMAPTRAGVEEAIGHIAARVAERHASSPSPTTLLLYYAGHGDAERGTGSLLLEDGRLLHADLRRAVDTIGASTTHVVLDACNAFFVAHARGAGGRAWATADTAGAALASTKSDVGLFLSTSAEAQVYEWSQLEGGIFSHAFRSGLRGAADVDLDGLVTYRELEAFVRTATEQLTNKVYVPHVFSRAPARGDVLLDLRAAPRVALAPPPTAEPARLTVRDAAGTIVVDVRPEPGFTPRVLLPAGELLVEIEDAAGGRSERRLGDDESTPLLVGARGPAPLLGRLFEEAWGPAAFGRFLRRPPPVEVFGLSAAQEQRLLLHLRTMRDAARETRQLSAWSAAAPTGALALGLAGSGIVLAGRGEATPAVALAATALGLGGLAVVEALGLFSPVGDAERAADEVLAAPPRPDDPTPVRAARVARAVDTIQQAATHAPEVRALAGGIAGATALLSVGLGAAVFSAPAAFGEKAEESSIRSVGGGLMLIGALSASLGVVAFLQPSDAERLERLMREDPESIVNEAAPGP